MKLDFDDFSLEVPVTRVEAADALSSWDKDGLNVASSWSGLNGDEVSWAAMSDK